MVPKLMNAHVYSYMIDNLMKQNHLDINSIVEFSFTIILHHVVAIFCKLQEITIV